MGAKGVFQQLTESHFVNASLQELISMRNQHNSAFISTKLSQKQLQEMMQVIEDIRLNKYKETL